MAYRSAGKYYRLLDRLVAYVIDLDMPGLPKCESLRIREIKLSFAKRCCGGAMSYLTEYLPKASLRAFGREIGIDSLRELETELAARGY